LFIFIVCSFGDLNAGAGRNVDVAIVFSVVRMPSAQEAGASFRDQSSRGVRMDMGLNLLLFIVGYRVF
jgi:hypothetical protein